MDKKPYQCPNCLDGTLVLVDGVYHCDKCDYEIRNKLAVESNNRCPECGHFLLLKRGNRFIKSIVACSNPLCSYKISKK